MTKTLLISVTALSLVLMSGCSTTEPTFDANDTIVQSHDSRSYNIPKGAHISPYVDAKVLKVYTEAGLKNCDNAALTWEADSVSEEIGKAIEKGNKGIFKKLAKENKIGCVKPIN
jgi:protein involved in sex pheromone biosynthesis